MRTATFPFMLAAVLTVFLGGCDSTVAGWDLAQSSATNIVPSCAQYDFATGAPINDTHHATFLFTVVDDGPQQEPVLQFSSDGYRQDTIAITDGAFYKQWGTIGGRHCPTDSYAISGHFTTAGRAEGTIKLAYDGRVTATATFVATAPALAANR